MSERFLRRRIEDEEVWLDLEGGEFFTVNATGVRVLELWRQGIREPAELARRLSEQFEVTEADALHRVGEFLVDARGRGFLPE